MLRREALEQRRPRAIKEAAARGDEEAVMAWVGTDDGVRIEAVHGTWSDRTRVTRSLLMVAAEKGRFMLTKALLRRCARQTQLAELRRALCPDSSCHGHVRTARAGALEGGQGAAGGRGRGCCSLAQRNRPWRRHRVAGLGPCKLIAYGSLAATGDRAARQLSPRSPRRLRWLTPRPRTRLCSLAQRDRPGRRHRVAGLGSCKLIAYGSLAVAVRLAARLGGWPFAHLAAFGG